MKGLEEVTLYIMTSPTDDSFRILQRRIFFKNFFLFGNLRKKHLLVLFLFLFFWSGTT